MKLSFILLTASTLAIASVANAQDFTSSDNIDDRITEIEDSVKDEFEKGDDAERFGAEQYAQGWTGSASATFSSQSSSQSVDGVDTDTSNVDFALGARLKYGAGPWNQTLNLTLDYSSVDGDETEKSILVGYDVNRYFTTNFYGFGILTAEFDSLNFDTFDGFAGVGIGYRILNSENSTWRVQAGPGWRYIKDGFDVDTDEAGVMLSSRAYYKLTDTAFISNDTDVLWSDISTAATNDFGVTFKVTDALSTRLGLRTDYEGMNDNDDESLTNKLTAALVMSF